MSCRFSCLVACWLVSLLLAPGTCDPLFHLRSWLESSGAHIGYEVKRPCPRCPRGAFATTAYAPGDVIAEVPLTLAVNLGHHSVYTSVTLFDRLLLDPAFNASYGVYWASLPGPDEVLSLDTITPDQLDMLQSDNLYKLVSEYQATRSRLFYSTGGVLNTVFEHTNGNVIPSIDAYKYVCGIVTTRSFYFTDPEHNELQVYLVPMVDMINHGSRLRNVVRKQRGWKVQVVATAPILQGQELLAEYDANVVHRPDMSLLIYGFAPPEHEDLLLPASDLPGFSTALAFRDTPRHDDLSKVDPSTEIRRVQEIIAGTDSSLQDDEAKLKALEGELEIGGAGSAGEGWKEAEILKFRVRRKRALWRRLAFLLEGTDSSGAA